MSITSNGSNVYSNIYPLNREEDSYKRDSKLSNSCLSNYLSTRARAKLVDTPLTDNLMGNNIDNSIKSHGKSIHNDINDISAIKDAYFAALGRPCPSIYLDIMADYIHAGMAVEVIIDIIYRTADAPRPSWAYAFAVIRRSYADGVRTQSDMTERDKRRSACSVAGRSDQRSLFHSFDQRDIDDHYYDGIYVNLKNDT